MEYKRGLVDRIVERSTSKARIGEVEAEAPFWHNPNAWIAAATGAALLLVTYGFTDDRTFSHDATHEIGFALIVAVLIWIIFEVASRKESNKAWNERIDRISKNVFFGVLGRNLSPGVIDEARIVVLDHSFERSDFHVTYNLSDATYQDRCGQARSFVALRAHARFKIRNISNRRESFPVGVGLPNPFVDEMKTHCRVHRVCIKDGDKEPRELQVDAINADLQAKLANDGSSQVHVKAEDIDLNPGDERVVMLEYTMAKEDEDTELVQTRYPTDTLTVTMVDTSNPKHFIKARSIHRVDLEEVEAGENSGIYVFRLEKYLLPYQGFAIWWKKRPPPPTGSDISN